MAALEEIEERIPEMKLKLIAVAALVACSAAAVPTGGQIEMAEHMKRIVIPVFDIKPQTTLPDAITYLRQQSIEHGDPAHPKGERGISFLLKGNLAGRAVPKLLAKNISLYDALNLVCQSTGSSFFLQESAGKVIVVIESLK